ncbi:MAG: DUF1840 domain-containing protein [Rubrivivax sp.]|nr:DUF1840 domain-containing protein [Rubrivivax sp.]
MIYKFSSKAAGNVIMLGPNGDELMRVIGREPAAKGIFEPAAMPAIIAALEAAVDAEDARRLGADKDDDKLARGSVSLRQRVWPLVEMLRQAQTAGKPIVWGV